MVVMNNEKINHIYFPVIGGEKLIRMNLKLMLKGRGKSCGNDMICWNNSDTLDRVLKKNNHRLPNLIYKAEIDNLQYQISLHNEIFEGASWWLAAYCGYLATHGNPDQSLPIIVVGSLGVCEDNSDVIPLAIEAPQFATKVADLQSAGSGICEGKRGWIVFPASQVINQQARKALDSLEASGWRLFYIDSLSDKPFKDLFGVDIHPIESERPKVGENNVPEPKPAATSAMVWSLATIVLLVAGVLFWIESGGRQVALAPSVQPEKKRLSNVQIRSASANTNHEKVVSRISDDVSLGSCSGWWLELDLHQSSYLYLIEVSEYTSGERKTMEMMTLDNFKGYLLQPGSIRLPKEGYFMLEDDKHVGDIHLSLVTLGQADSLLEGLLADLQSATSTTDRDKTEHGINSRLKSITGEARQEWHYRQHAVGVTDGCPS
jgi:hypothetical protein